MVSNEIIGVIVLAAVAFVIVVIYLFKCISDCLAARRKGSTPGALTDEDLIQISLESRADPIPNDAYDDMGQDTTNANHNDFSQVCRSLEVAARKDKFNMINHTAWPKGYIPLTSPSPGAPELGIESDENYDTPRAAQPEQQETYDIPMNRQYPTSPITYDCPKSPAVVDASVIVHQPYRDVEPQGQEHLYAPILKSPPPAPRSAAVIENDAPTFFPPRSNGGTVPPSVFTESSDSQSVTTPSQTYDVPPGMIGFQSQLETYDFPPGGFQEVPSGGFQESYDIPPEGFVSQEVYDVPPHHQDMMTSYQQETYDTPTFQMHQETENTAPNSQYPPMQQENTAPNSQQYPPVNSVFYIPDGVDLDECIDEEENTPNKRRQRRNSTRSIKTLDDIDLNGKPRKKKEGADGTPKAKKKRRKSVAGSEASETPSKQGVNIEFGEKNSPFSNLTAQPTARTYQL
eukprot:sb/3464537/